MKWLEHPLIQFTVFGLAMMAFFIIIKLSVNKLPDSGIGSDVKKIAMLA